MVAFPSLFEGFGLPILEALSCGCPVVASDIGAHREIYKKLQIQDLDSRNFGKLMPMILVKPKDVNTWARFLYQYISQYDKSQDRKSLSLAKKINQLTTGFSWDKVAFETTRVFEKLNRGNSG